MSAIHNAMSAAVRAAPVRRADVVVVGAGVTGMTTAIDLARLGHTVEVVEKYGADATRRNLFNLAPPVTDKLRALDGGTSELTGLLVPFEQFRLTDNVLGTRTVTAGRPFAPAPREAPGIDALLASHAKPPTDGRMWSRVRIEEIEDGLRRFAQRHHPDRISFHWQSEVASINGVPVHQLANAANPVGALDDAASGVRGLIPARQRVRVEIDGADGARTALEGAHLVYATGGRNPFGIQPTLDPDIAHFVGGEFPASKGGIAHRVREWGARLPGRVDRATNPPDAPYTTIALHYPHERSLLWAQLGHDPQGIDEQTLKAILRERASLAGLPGELLGEPIPVKIQLGSVKEAVDPERRIWLTGDELGPPYFPTSTGAGSGIAVDGPRTARAVHEALQPHADIASIARRYEREALADREKLLAVSRRQLHNDLHNTTPVR